MLPIPSASINILKDPSKDKWTENDLKILSDWQAPRNKGAFLIFLIASIFFIIFGIAFASLNQELDEYRIKYNDAPGCNSSSPTGQLCNTTLTIDRDMEPPIFIYYELENYFQNHRAYLESRDDEQLTGTFKNIDDIGSCSPIFANMHITGFYFNATYPPKFVFPNFERKGILKATDPATPCGLIARTTFTDRYVIVNLANKKPIPIDETGISWKYDRDNFKNTKNTSLQWLNHEDEHFQVWMRPAGLSKFKKLWGKINETLTKGTYLINFINVYPEVKFDANKYLVIASINMLGGKNTVLVYSYLITGGVCILLTIIFLIGWIREKKMTKME